MKKTKSISGQVFEVSCNKTARTYTIRTNGSKYRTNELSIEDFDNFQYNTGNDWANFMKTNDYYLVNNLKTAR